MAILETLIGSVGMAVGKALLKRWIKDDLASAATESLFEIAKKKITGIEEQNNTKRQFEAIGEKVGKSLLPVCEAETGLEEGDKVAAALALAHTIEKACVSTAELAKLDIDPVKLSKAMKLADPEATKYLGDNATALYHRLVDEACIAIVDIVDKLPHFQRDALKEILERGTRFEEIAIRILQETQAIRAESQNNNPEVAAQLFEIEYLCAVVRKLDRITLFGADLPERSRRYPLSVAYVTLSIENGAAKGPSGIDVDEALSSSKRLLIRGEAGSGKTTLLNWIAVRAAKHDFKHEALADWNSLVPFFIPLREFSKDESLPTPGEFPKLISSVVAETAPVGWVHRQLESGRAVVLIDGLDEISEAKREEVCEWLRDLMGLYEKTRFIVTARPNAAQDNWMESEKFEEASLQRMNLANINQFVQQWHEAVGFELQHEAEKSELRQMADGLKYRLETQPSVRALAANPLLCAMLCALNRTRNQNIPNRRVALYEACISMLLKRDDDRKIEVKEYPKLDELQKRLLLQRLAYWMQVNDYVAVPLSDAIIPIENALKTLQNLPQDATPERVFRLLAERTGIARSPIEGQLDFAHRTFQEYLAAKEVLDSISFGVLKQNAKDDRWRETLILAAGQATVQQADLILGDLLSHTDGAVAKLRGAFTGDKGRYTILTLVAAAIGEAAELSPVIKARAEKALSLLKPPETLEEARAWAAAKNHALPYLGHLKQHNNEVDARLLDANCNAARIYCLSLIGTEEAFSTLKEYIQDDRIAVQRALLTRRDGFKQEIYDNEILSLPLSLLKGYLPQASPPLRAETEPWQLKTDELVEAYDDMCKRFSDYGYVRPLVELSNLTHLETILPESGDLRFLKGLKRLESFTLCGIETRDMAALMKANQATVHNGKILFSPKFNPVDGAEMVWIPPGAFLMGSDDKDARSSEKPAHEVVLDGYWIALTPVTVEQYLKFCDETKREKPEAPVFNKDWSLKKHPIVNVSWHDADAYCKWAGGKLPSEAQWEKAARGTDGRKYPWGNHWDAQKCRNSTSKYGDSDGTIEVGHYPEGVSPYDVHDMAGNVWEWCEDVFSEEFYRKSEVINPVNLKGVDRNERRSLRGGSWINYGPDIFRCSYRIRNYPSYRNNYSGFRLLQI